MQNAMVKAALLPMIRYQKINKTDDIGKFRIA